jgi:hypothetical protein
MIGRALFGTFWNSIPTLAYAWLVEQLLGLPYTTALLVILGLFLVHWVVISVFSWFTFYLFGRDSLSKAAVQDMAEAGCPCLPKVDGLNAEHVLYDLAVDREQSASVRIHAAANRGIIDYLRMTHQFQALVRMNLAYRDALNQYGQRQQLGGMGPMRP